MDQFKFWARITISALLAFLGYSIASLLPLPSPFILNWTKVLYAAIGALVGLLTFAPMSSWMVQTLSRLVRQFITRMASEIINQFTQLTSRGWPFLPGPPAKVGQSGGENVLETNRFRSGGTLILDTSSIIDGRILDVAKSGFVSGMVLVPDFVLRELQQVADSADPLKRSRGRRGFEVINELKKIHYLKVEVWDRELVGKNVDDKLIRLAKAIHGKVVTCDFNLNRVARLSGVTVLNINDLSNALKSIALPGEKLSVKILFPGKDRNQGVGYLPDGTMVVVRDASEDLGKSIQIEVTKNLQGPAGRMIFGKRIVV